MALAAQYANEFATLILPTISLSVDYLAPVANGSWIEARPEIAKVTRGMVFVSELLTADGEPAVRAHGIFKRPPTEPTSPTQERSTGAALRDLLTRREAGR